MYSKISEKESRRQPWYLSLITQNHKYYFNMPSLLDPSVGCVSIPHQNGVCCCWVYSHWYRPWLLWSFVAKTVIFRSQAKSLRCALGIYWTIGNTTLPNKLMDRTILTVEWFPNWDRVGLLVILLNKLLAVLMRFMSDITRQHGIHLIFRIYSKDPKRICILHL